MDLEITEAAEQSRLDELEKELDVAFKELDQENPDHTVKVQVSLPMHLVSEDSPDTEKLRSMVVEHIFMLKNKAKSKLVDVSVTTFHASVPEKQP